MDWFRRMSERDRLNSILPFFLPSFLLSNLVSLQLPSRELCEFIYFFGINFSRFSPRFTNFTERFSYRINLNRRERERENIWKAICCCTDIIPYFDFDELLQITRLFSDKLFLLRAHNSPFLSFPLETEISRTTKAKGNTRKCKLR